MKRPFSIFIYIVLIFYFSLFFSQKISLITADLGRHITNGRVFFETGKIVSTNFYSFTQPDFPAPNHHWLSGVIFYVVNYFGGFTGLSLFYLLICGVTVFLFFKTAEQKSNFQIAFLVTLFLIPLISDRREIRPEGFSYLLMGLYYYLLCLYKENKIKFRPLIVLITLSQLVWVNLHIFFIFGICIILAFLVTEMINAKLGVKNSRVKKFALMFGASVLVSLINPYFFKGLLEPFYILKEYGYMIVENQSIFFMQKRMPNFEYIQFEFISIIFILAILLLIFTKRIRKYLVQIFILFSFMILAFRAIRGIPIAGLFLVPFLSEFLYKEFRKTAEMIPVYFVGAAILTLMPGHYFSPFKPGFGTGLLPGVNNSAQFFNNAGIKGPIFNNYDIGGYLIYNLYGKEKVFVDNRPEAYSVAFFKDTYVPMQEKEDVWKQADQKYNLNTVFFYRLDMTPWAQPFLINRLRDKDWAAVYVDDYSIILVKRNEQNKYIIDKFELPSSLFKVTK